MRKTLFLALIAFSAVASAQVTPITGPFPTFAICQENFDSILGGSYAAAPLFTPPMYGTIYALNSPNLIDIMPPPGWQPPALSAPNTAVGTGTDLGIRVSPIMRRFGGWFRNAPNSAGIAPQFAKVVFYDSSGVFIGSVGIPVTNTWTWFGWKVNPKFSRVEIYSGFPGGIELDDIEVRPV